MEEKPSEELMVVAAKGKGEELPGHGEPKPNPKRPKKRRGAMHFLKIALFMMRNRSEKSKGFSGSRSVWRKLVGSVRPLQLQPTSDSSPPTPKICIEEKTPVPLLTIDASPAYTEFSEDILFSPSEGSSRSGSDTPYASAVGLNEMVQAEAVESDSESNEGDGHGDGDKMIDAKAEEFIANFYHQMRLQRQHSITERSLG